jgi:hypothetical protein
MHILQRGHSDLGARLKILRGNHIKLATTRTEGDLLAWEQWNASKSNFDLQKLMKRMEGLIISNVTKWQVRVPRSSLRAEAERLAMRAFKTYNPNNFGKASVATHVNTWLQKLHAFSSKHGDISKRPEDRFAGARRFNETEEHLKKQLKREPTAAEVADYMKISIPEVGRYRQEQTKTLIERHTTELSAIEAIDPTKRYALEAVYYDLTPDEKLVYEHIKGRAGRRRTHSTGEIARLTGMTASKISRLKKGIAKKLEMFL